MPMTHCFADNGSLLVGYFLGRVTADDVLADAADAFKSPHYYQNMDRLHILHPSFDGSEMDMEALKRIQTIHARTGAQTSSNPSTFRAAFLTHNDLQRSIIKLYSVLWDLDHNSKTKIQSFRTLEEALEWLGHTGTVIPSFSEVFGRVVME